MATLSKGRPGSMGVVEDDNPGYHTTGGKRGGSVRANRGREIHFNGERSSLETSMFELQAL